ncbi:hypothetical protein KHA94_04160 [Bacillus sp. FJAT-49705]|uniref:Uncharacterized protein n=1 Tax=Cytobacillus citreus TaxID=2833586 RepID=A0ABS5NNK5_9BACI|nr:hypothetical protein [Cytobacillus citreus]MBS4189412.1 hypothetical protein [Cytobacillus citreus]
MGISIKADVFFWLCKCSLLIGTKGARLLKNALAFSRGVYILWGDEEASGLFTIAEYLQRNQQGILT